MTKKHFVMLAATLHGLKPARLEDVLIDKTLDPELARVLVAGRVQQWEATCDRLASFCQSQNAQFDRERFLVACGLVEKPKELCPLCGEYKHKPGQRC